jgi:hypothetical protein
MPVLDSSFYGLLCIATGLPSATGPQPSIPATHLPELHLNIWEKGESAFLDIGLMLDIAEQAQTFEFLVPWKISIQEIDDLSERLFEVGAMPAVFNEGWEVTRNVGSRNGRATDPANGKVLFSILEVLSDLEVKSIPHNNHQLASISVNVMSLRRKAMAMNHAASKMYVRFRLKEVPKDFYRVGINQQDRLFVSSWQRTEIIDFRLNVRRGVPLGLENQIGKFVQFSKVHLFLMKSRDQDIVFEDNLFKACRSLEDENFWATYSLPASADSSAKKKSLTHVQQSLGYQWTKVALVAADGTVTPVKEYSILARYKNVRFGIFKFVIIALIVGALGNALWDGVKLRFGDGPTAQKIQKFIAPTPTSGDKQ